MAPDAVYPEPFGEPPPAPSLSSRVSLKRQRQAPLPQGIVREYSYTHSAPFYVDTRDPYNPISTWERPRAESTSTSTFVRGDTLPPQAVAKASSNAPLRTTATTQTRGGGEPFVGGFALPPRPREPLPSRRTPSPTRDGQSFVGGFTVPNSLPAQPTEPKATHGRQKTYESPYPPIVPTPPPWRPPPSPPSGPSPNPPSANAGRQYSVPTNQNPPIVPTPHQPDPQQSAPKPPPSKDKHSGGGWWKAVAGAAVGALGTHMLDKRKEDEAFKKGLAQGRQEELVKEQALQEEIDRMNHGGKSSSKYFVGGDGRMGPYFMRNANTSGSTHK